MLRLSLSLVGWFATFFRSRHNLGLELVALRQQLGVLKRKNPRPRLSQWDRLFWVALRRFWSRWAEVLIVVKRETVVSWHRAGFRFYWLCIAKTRSVVGNILANSLSSISPQMESVVRDLLGSRIERRSYPGWLWSRNLGY